MLGIAVALGFSACHDDTRTFTTTVEIVHVRRFGQAPPMTDLEVRFTACPGNARKVMRAPREFSGCGSTLAVGQEVEAVVELKYDAERRRHRDTIVRLGGCPLALDDEDAANYQSVENCTELVHSGMVVGVHCDRRRSPELLATCPWFRRD